MSALDEKIAAAIAVECPECHRPWVSRLSADRCCTETD